MLLDEIRILARKKKEEVYNDPASSEFDKSFVDMAVKFFSNEDYITQAAKSAVVRLLFYIGYRDMIQARLLYKQLINEIDAHYNKQYNVISPEQLKELMEAKGMK